MLEGTFYPSNLVIGDIVTDDIVLQSGQNLKAGSVLGKVKFTCPTSGTAGGSNTGNGTVTLVKAGRFCKIGTYTITIIEAATDFLYARVTDPDGRILGTVPVGTGTDDTGDFGSEQIEFRLKNGSTDFVANDVFTIVVTEGVPNSGTANGGNTGNGTLVQVDGRRSIEVGTYTIACTTAGTNGGVFGVTSPGSADLGSINASKFAGTGNGTLTEVVAGPRFKRSGAYIIKCTSAVTNGGVFSVTDPDGTVIGSVTITPGASGTGIFNHEQISFKLTDGSTDFVLNDAFTLYLYEGQHLSFILWDGSTDFIVGDSFTVAVTVANRECKLVNSDNTDGSNEPFAILLEDTDASAAAKRAPGLIGGQVNENALIFGGNDTIETHRQALRQIGIVTKRAVAAA